MHYLDCLYLNTFSEFATQTIERVQLTYHRLHYIHI